MQNDGQQCGFCEAPVTVWVSFVSAKGVAYQTGLCQQHAGWTGVLDPKGFALVEGWGLPPQSQALGEDAGDGATSLQEAILKAAFDAISKGASVASGKDFKSLSVQLQTHLLTPEQAGGAGVSGAACPQCGLRLVDWKTHGRLGCAHCYTAFARQVTASLPALHGGRVDHWGKIPAGKPRQNAILQRIELWRQTLAHAVEREAYEQAAQARDQIRELEAELGC